MPSRRTPPAARPTKRRQSSVVRPAHPPVEPEEKDRPDDRSNRLLIVGIGASAGGLEAFTQLLARLTRGTGMAFVLVQHLDPDHESALTQILSRATPLPVREITHNQPLQADHVYVIPRDTNLSIVESMLKLKPRVRTRSPHRPIDSFFESLAQDQGERAIGIVLSGTASDGTLGLEAIKAEGGFTFAQDDSAKYDSMPRSAIAAGCVDLVLSPEGIANELVRIGKHPFVAGDRLGLPTRPEKDHESAVAHQEDDQPLPSGGRGTPPTGGRQARDEAEGKKRDPENGAEDGYKKIMLLLRNHSGVDFSLYRSSTIQRRIARRIVLAKQDTLKGYARFLRGNTEELDSLFSDVLISVTSFFRNPEAFDVLQRNILPKLLAQREDNPVRCWVLGCSTGQEAYSLAMSFVEAARKAPRARKIQIFATDLNEKLLEKARQGLYAKTLAQDLSAERLRQFFVEEDGGYRISKALREMVVFARQNLIADPPFSRMDLISCRNLLIYLDPSLQQKVMPTFHYALKSQGYLLLGASESVGEFTSLFEPVDRKHKIFSKKPAPSPGFHMLVRKEPAKRAARRALPPLPIGKMGLPDGVESPEGFRGELNAQREADRIAVSQFAPPGVLINDALQVLQFRGPTGAYLEPPAGKASFDVLKMAREGLMLPLRAAINKAKQGNKTVRAENVRVKRDGVARTIHVAVIPLKNLRERCFLVVFEEAGETGRAAAHPPLRRQPAATPLSAQQELRRIAELEVDLSETREYLQSLQEQHEAANEELQAANEEVQSANEELQSINEELETSKEELESTNEELTTVNEEMLNRNADLNRLNNDLVNLHASTKLAIVLLGRDLTVRRFSPQAEKQFDLLAADVGRPISHIRHALVLTDGAESPLDLEALSAEVIADVREQEHEVRDKSGRWHSLRVRPYLTLDNKVDGAVLVLVDIDALKRSEQAAAVARAFAENTVETVREPLVVLDHQLHIERANRAFYRHFRSAPAETVGKFIYEVNNHQWDIPSLRELLDKIPAQRATIEDFLVEHDFDHLGHRTMLLNARLIEDPPHKTERILLAIEDITERKQAQASSARLAAIVESSDDAIVGKDLRGIVTSWNRGAEILFGYSASEMVGQSIRRLIPPERMGEEDVILAHIERNESMKHFETVRLHKDGSFLNVSVTVSAIKDAEGRIVGASKVARNTTDRKIAEEALRESEARFRTLADNMSQFAWMADATGWIFWYNRRWYEYSGTTFEDMQGWGWEKIHHPDHLDHVLTSWRRSHATGEPWQDTFPLRDKDGIYRWFLSRAMPIRDAEGKVTRWFGTNTEITELRETQTALRQSEERLRSIYSQLEQLVEERTRELLQAQERLRLLAMELNLAEQRQRKRLAREMHDSLAQWLVICCLNLGRVQQTDLSPTTSQIIKETEEMLDKALDYSRTLMTELSPPVLQEHGLPAGLVWLGEHMQRHGLTVTVDVGTRADFMLPDDCTMLLFQSVRELMMNVLKHAESKEVAVRIFESDGDLCIEVRDEGVGFDLAESLASAMSMSSQFGLLSIRERMKALGGRFDLKSSPGAGTTATLVLPLKTADSTELKVLSAELSDQVRNSEPRTQNSKLHQQEEKIRVLLVDDHAMVRQGLRAVLESYPDVEVVGEAGNGEEAVEYVGRLQPTIVVMDINMPKMNGIKATAQITSRFSDIIVIGLSVQAGNENEVAMRNAGASMLLTKEAAVEELYKAIRESLDLRLKGNVLPAES